MPKYFEGVLSSNEYGNRLILKKGALNPRDELGKMGITTHNWFTSIFYKTIKVRVVVGKDNQGRKIQQTFNLNRNSLVKYIRASQPTLAVHRNNTDSYILKSLKKVLTTAVPTDGGTLRHAGRQNQIELFNSLTAMHDRNRANFFSWLYQKTIGRLSSLKFRFLFVKTEADYASVGQLLAKQRFHEAKASVPAYRNHLSASGAITRRLSDVPITSKANYIKANETQDWNVHQNGTYPEKAKIDTSTGTTGKATVWRRGKEEVKTVKKSLRVAAEIEYGSRKVFYINAFALGPWATGMTGYEIMRETGSVFAAGADMEKIIDQLESEYRYQLSRIENAVNAFLSAKVEKRKHSLYKVDLVDIIKSILSELVDRKKIDIAAELGKLAAQKGMSQFVASHLDQLVSIISKLDKTQNKIVLAGYPPFLKSLVDYAKEKHQIDFGKYHADAVVGGQSISEALRDNLVAAGFSTISSSYGASDLDINIGVETDFERGLRRALENNPALRAELFGKNKTLPMVFHYDPLNYHIECDDNDELIFTCVRSDRSSPRIRYDLGDKGRVYSASDIQAMLLKHGITDLKPRVNLPLLFVWGRDNAVAYEGCKVSFDDLERAITKIDSDQICVKRAFYEYHDPDGSDKVEIWIELADGAKIPEKTHAQSFLHNLLVEMGRINQDFRSHIGDDKKKAALPLLRFFKKGESPISDATGHRKQVLVFNEKNTAADFVRKLPEMPAEQIISIEKTAAFVADANDANRHAHACHLKSHASGLQYLPGQSIFAATAPQQDDKNEVSVKRTNRRRLKKKTQDDNADPIEIIQIATGSESSRQSKSHKAS